MGNGLRSINTRSGSYDHLALELVNWILLALTTFPDISSGPDLLAFVVPCDTGGRIQSFQSSPPLLLPFFQKCISV